MGLEYRSMLKDKAFVYLSEVIPSVKEDVKYSYEDNFTGRRVHGYFANKIIVTEVAAYALLNVQRELKGLNYGLLVWDGYRPERAVNDFLKWREEPDNEAIKQKYYPEFQKEDLFKMNFIAPGKSSHSRGSTVDLTIIELESGKELDMGTKFDFFGTKSHTENQEIPIEAKKNRKLLKGLMEKNGFVNLPTEWWHYTLKEEAYKDRYFDFIIK